MLPSPFAIFTERPPTMDEPLPKPYAIILAHQQGPITRCEQVRISRYDNTVMRLSSSSNDERSIWTVNIGMRIVHFWFTGWYIDGIIVLDYDDRAALNVSEGTHSIYTDNIMKLCSRQVEQRELRRHMMSIIRSQRSPPSIIRQTWPSVFSEEYDYGEHRLEIPELVFDDFDEAPRILHGPEDRIIPLLVPPSSTNAIPRFVAEAMKRDAIASGGSCPITTTTFENRTAVAVTACYHLFEDAALKQWMTTKMLCPICKAALNDSPIVV
jgi:hypothetical protein